MPVKRDQPLPRASEVIERMEVGHKYRADELAIKFRTMCAPMHSLLREMVLQGAISCCKGARDSRYFIPIEEKLEEERPGHYVPEFRPLGILDLTTFQRQCEAARNKDTGMV